MNNKEFNILTEIIDNMDKILVEKQDKHNNTWKDCDLAYLRLQISKRANQLFICKSIDKKLREIIHLFNYLFFLYYRLLKGIKSNNFKLALS